MKLDLRAHARQALIRLGGRLGTERLHDARNVLGALALGRWLADHPSVTGVIGKHPEKTGVYQDAVAMVTGKTPLYLEFGVWEGLSLRWWAEHLKQPGARFVGFDSFEGLPEQWRPDYPPGTFAVGRPPAIDDDRVSFQVGWFADTLRDFELPEHDQLVVNIDCTLYSSTATVLQALEKHIKPGDLIYFDELPEYDHELRAFFEHVERCGWVIRPVSHARGYYWLFSYE
ncbi:class I SAM-dependent methyltransferase [Streptacidiphilus sp. PB12-B1b]|uniref:class I SAM-dependent methyltransferase n=1 Tax=Streptacidiphilus sp. PB12-B1b TaxID=2705012 RepID=UPI0015F9B8E1|nr:class I SAM-dependent methyltransferase [Streptacidiphilus sp. PB12-B1b]QMU76343.1 class I SAM-dependent methyltransferase [Streptacidiphilus sp. PB12-B1b]